MDGNPLREIYKGDVPYKDALLLALRSSSTCQEKDHLMPKYKTNSFLNKEPLPPPAFNK